MSTYTIGIPIVEKFDLMDVANPYEVFSWIQPFYREAGTELKVLLIGHGKGTQVQSFNGASLTAQACFADFAEEQLDLIFVPGGGSDYIAATRKDKDLLEFVRTQAKDAKLVASVCTGAFVLAEAGVLEGLRATTHWMFQEELQKRYPSVQVVNGYPRFVTDGKFMTGGGISSGIDAALYLAGTIAGEQVGRDIELAIQYRPQPPYGTGDPAVADYTTWKQVTTDLA